MPLTSLMIQQESKLKTAGYAVTLVTDHSTAVTGLQSDARYLLMSPETLASVFMRTAQEHRSDTEHISCVFIDESHCVSKWYVE